MDTVTIHTIWLWIININYIVLIVRMNRLQGRIENGGL